MADMPNRQPEDSAFEVSIRGPRDGFVEDISINIALIRKRLRTSSLVLEEFTLGKRSQTKLALMYIDDIIDTSIIDNLREKLHHISIDILSSSQQLEDLISD